MHELQTFGKLCDQTVVPSLFCMFLHTCLFEFKKNHIWLTFKGKLTLKTPSESPFLSLCFE